MIVDDLLIDQELRRYQEEYMSYYYDSKKANLACSIDKFVVISTAGNFEGSFAKEKDAVNCAKKAIKDGSKKRYVILEAKKEVGAKSPEIEIEVL